MLLKKIVAIAAKRKIRQGAKKDANIVRCATAEVWT